MTPEITNEMRAAVAEYMGWVLNPDSTHELQTWAKGGHTYYGIPDYPEDGRLSVELIKRFKIDIEHNGPQAWANAGRTWWQAPELETAVFLAAYARIKENK